MLETALTRRVGASYLVWEKERCEVQRAVFALAAIASEVRLIASAGPTRRLVIVGGLWGPLNAGTNRYKFYGGTDAAIGSALTGGLLELQVGVIRPLWAPWGLFKTGVGEALWFAGTVYPYDFPGVLYYITPEG